MTPSEIEAYLHAHIPLSKAMGARVVAVDENRVTVEAALEPNVNHRATAFGGSVSALAILAGWTTVHFRLQAEGYEAETVIHESAVRYDAPISGSFRAVSKRVDDERWSRFTRALARRGKGRVEVEVVVQADGIAAASFRGSYVALADGHA